MTERTVRHPRMGDDWNIEHDAETLMGYASTWIALRDENRPRAFMRSYELKYAKAAMLIATMTTARATLIYLDGHLENHRYEDSHACSYAASAWSHLSQAMDYVQYRADLDARNAVR